MVAGKTTYALVDGQLQMPSFTGQRASCPECGEAMRAQVGPKAAPHWAHCELSPHLPRQEPQARGLDLRAVDSRTAAG